MRPGLHGRLLAAVVLAVALALALTVLAFNLILGSRLDADANDLAALAGDRGAARIRCRYVNMGGLLCAGGARTPARLTDACIWVFSGSTMLESASERARSLIGAARALAHRRRPLRRRPGC